tara:strand:+ start:7554 stop:8036 length:483 start_codon:yes stop_codon:yes gene_type:complete
MSRFLDSRCGVPIFMMDNENVARRCGRLNGFVSAISFTIFFLIGTIILTINLNKKRKDINGEIIPEDKDKKFVWWPIATGIGCILLSWLTFPFLGGYFNVMSYEFKQNEKRAMKKRGLSDKEIYAKQQNLYEKRLESRSRIRAAQIQADAMREAFSGRRR